nr:hypothetical protein [Tanacetum cinerariifolium]
NINKLFQPWRSFGAVINKCLTGKSHGFDSFRNTKAYKEYYAYATGEAAPKTKASTKRKRSGSDTSITPPTTITTPKTTSAVTPRLTAAAKGKQPAKAKSPSDPSELARTEAQQLKIIAKIDVHDDTERGGDDDEESENDEESDDEETREEESFDPIPRTPKDSEDDGNDEEDQGFKDGEDEWLNEEEEADELYRDQESSSVSSQFVTSMINPTSDVGMESIFATASSSVAHLPTPTPTMTPSIIT